MDWLTSEVSSACCRSGVGADSSLKRGGSRSNVVSYTCQWLSLPSAPLFSGDESSRVGERKWKMITIKVEVTRHPPKHKQAGTGCQMNH